MRELTFAGLEAFAPRDTILRVAGVATFRVPSASEVTTTVIARLFPKRAPRTWGRAPGDHRLLWNIRTSIRVNSGTLVHAC